MPAILGFFFVLICAFLLVILFCAGTLNKRGEALQPVAPLPADMVETDWYPPAMKPERVGLYKVRLPLSSVEMVHMAMWDGSKWVDTMNGMVCFFQQLSWCGLEFKVPHEG